MQELPAPTTDQAALLAVKGLNAGYGDIEILWDINLEIRPKERVAIVGPNGAGKTTLLRTISGLLTQQGGSIHLEGKDISAMRPHNRVEMGISQVPEGRLLFAGMSVKENLMMGSFTVTDPVRIQNRLMNARWIISRSCASARASWLVRSAAASSRCAPSAAP